jgi:RNA polymerase sigma-70 factor (ECF subfamily)
VSGWVDREDVRRLYDQHGPALLAYACSILRDYSTAEDMLHQVFVRLLRGDIKIAGSPSSYLFTAVRNAALDYRRHHFREVSLEIDVGWLESPAGMKETGISLQSALWELPEEQREIIVLHVWGQMKFEEAAQVLGISPNTAASRYRYGLTKLREKLKPDAED